MVGDMNQEAAERRWQLLFSDLSRFFKLRGIEGANARCAFLDRRIQLDEELPLGGAGVLLVS
jgi:hypothetical protein